MKAFFEKIINSFLALSLALVLIGTTYYLTTSESEIPLKAAILDGVPEDLVCNVDFIVPKGDVYPTNGVVTVQTVNVSIDTDVPTYCDGIADSIVNENLSGNNLENSYITFTDGSIPCPAGTIYSGNQIILPDTFAGSCTVDILVAGTTTNANGDDFNGAELTIEPLSCLDLQTSILRGQGSGFGAIDVNDLGVFSTTETSGGFDFTSGITSIDLNYPTTMVPNAQTFQIYLDFVADIATDPINGIAGRAEIVNNNGFGIYEIAVRNEIADEDTALNFAYVFNDLLGVNSPFIAYLDDVSDTTINLQAVEMGSHGNDYECLVDGAAVASCFQNGADATGDLSGVLSIPLTLDDEVMQGDSAIVFAGGSSGELEWISSFPSILEVTTLSEAAQDSVGVVDFVDEALDDSGETVDKTLGGGASYNIINCDKIFDENDNFVSETCEVELSIPVEYDISGFEYSVNVSLEDDVVDVTVSGSKLNGFLTGNGTYTTGDGGGSGGFSVSLSGGVTGAVSGITAGQFSGSVNGEISAQITASTSMIGLGSGNELSAASVESNISLPAPIEGTLTDVPSSFTSTVKKQDEDISNVAILYGKRPGTTILTAIDTQGCIASFDIEVIEQKVILQMVGQDEGDVLDVSDTVQINAFVGGANSEIDEYNNITSDSGIEWFSSNEEVASIDNTGLLTALKPGVTNITARYDTGDAEIGTIESIPMSVTVNKITGLRVTFNEATEDKLPSAIVDTANESVIIAINNPEAAGQTMIIEGQSIDIKLPAGTYTNDISKVEAIADDLETSINALTDPDDAHDLIDVTTIDGFPGLLILQANEQSDDHNDDGIMDAGENGFMDVDTTALENDLTILPTYNNVVNLPSSETFGLRVIAEYDNGATKLLPPTEFNWVNTPVNYLDDASLATGLITRGEISGTSTVLAEFLNADGSVVQSNYLTIKIEQGPVIEYVRRIGSSSITKGSRINLQTKITDVDTVADITNITTSLVFTNFKTYNEINADDTAIWFTAQTFLNELTIDEEGGTPADTTGDEDGEETVTTTSVSALPYKIYNIPLEIPVDQNLFDEIYQLIISITDSANHTLNYVYPIRIGEIGEGDVNGDGKTDMIDVILAFQIATGMLANPTPAQLNAANVDGIGGVTLIDVILLFNLVTA